MSENKKKNSLLSRQEVRQQYGLSVRFLEECHRKTKEVTAHAISIGNHVTPFL